MLTQEKGNTVPEIRENIALILNEFKREEMRSFLKDITVEYSEIGDSPLYGGKHCGSDAERQGARFIYDKLIELGAEAEMLPFESTRFCFRDASVSFEGQEREIRPYACLSVPTPEGGITGELTDVGDGHSDFYLKNDIRGRIALIETKEEFEDGTTVGMFQMYEAEKNGAAAIILYTNDYIYDDETIRATYSAFRCDIPVVTISSRDAGELKERMKRGGFEVTLTVDTEYAANGGTSYDVVGEIKGRTDERIVYSAHLDHFFRCVQDNISAVATLLGIVKAVKESGYTPNRTINFVFSGSHEIGMMGSAAPDLLGSWKLLDELKEEWSGKIIADINFEYTALETKKLRSNVSYEMKKNYLDFLRYMPDEMPGLGTVERDIDLNGYYLLTWCDACTYIMKGVPVFMNDTVYEQVYEDSSPYIGRDHSNRDDFEVYSSDAHVSSTAWYAALGIYLDNRPVIAPDYDERCARLRFDDDEAGFLRKAGIDTAEYLRGIDSFESRGRAVASMLEAYNERGSVTSEKTARINGLLSEIQHLLGKYTDGLTTAVPSMIQVPHKVYIEKGMLLSEAMDIAAERGWDAAYAEKLSGLDMAGLGGRFSDDLIMRMRSFILGENATWNAGKCRNVFTYEDVVPEKLEETYRVNAEAVREALEEERRCFEKACDILCELIIELTGYAGEERMMRWIKGFTALPHRRTGTEEGRRSAEYVRRTFEGIGLDEVMIETIPSVGMDCTEYSLTVDGADVECFFANGTNRRDETGNFISDAEEREIIYLGRGSEKDFDGADVSGKLVICDVYFKDNHPLKMLDWCEGAELYDPDGRVSKPLRKYDIYTPNDWPYNYIRAMENGAAGFIGILHNFMDAHYYHEDYTYITENGGYMAMPAVWVSKEDGERIKALLRERNVNGSMRVHTSYEDCDARIVSGKIKGRSDDIIVIHSHHDAVCAGAVQDASGMSEVFALADYFSRLPDGMIEKTLMFVSTDSHYTDYEGHAGFIKNRKLSGDKIIADFAIEHIAAEMDLDEDNNIVLTGEAETRMIYVDSREGLPGLVKKALRLFNVDKTVIFPVTKKSGGEFTNDDVCSDAYDFNADGIPVVSMLSAPMYLFHDSDDVDKVHRGSLVKVFKMYAYMIMTFMWS